MALITEEQLKKMTEIVAREVDPEAIVLFGSHAVGKAHEDSDVDLLIIESASFSPGRGRRKEMARLWQALMGFPVAKDILVYSREEVERWRHSRNHIIARALREGRVLYERP
ncbi:MAG TPA: nucleotidyltransferase domain-containing protein [bacterium]|nr:nucleotidyltransferase domain-containing protein [bacterium]